MDYLESIEALEVLRKSLYRNYQEDKHIASMTRRNRESLLRRTLWNAIYWYVEHKPGSVIADMLSTAYRMGLVDASFEPNV